MGTTEIYIKEFNYCNNMIEKYTTEMKKKAILDFLKEGGNIGFSQGDIARGLMNELMYSNEVSARVSIGVLLDDLKKEKRAIYEKRKAKRGGIMSKIWYANDGIQAISGKE